MSETTLAKHAHNFQNLAGRVFGLLTVVRFAGRDSAKRAVWECRCACSAVLVVRAWNLKNGHQRSCGCMTEQWIGEANTTHGRTRTRLYTAWNAMHERCRNPKNDEFHNYGGRGIRVCERWSRFEAFLQDVGEPPTDRHTLERIETNGNYEPGNCKWATRKEQARNKRNNRLITFRGKTRSLVEWGEETGFGGSRIGNRLRIGWSIERALTEQANPKRVAAGKRRGRR